MSQANTRIARALLLTVAATSILLAGADAGAAQSVAACEPGPMPYGTTPGALLTPEVHVSADTDPTPYVRWRGFVPSFDGLPLSVDVTVPCGLDAALPAMLMAHGFTDDKTIWQETGKTDTIESADRPASNSRWNNVWFASRGYVTVNYTARGWRDSCGPDTPGATPPTPAPQCAAFEYWIHLDDKRWEVRDGQWLLGGLVASGHADPDRLAMTGGSYGGAPTLMMALLDDNIMCGGAPQPENLGPDPCEGRSNGELAPWTTPDGDVRLRLSAAVPTITFADIVQVLAPNGRTSDGWDLAPAHGDVTSPVGIPIQSSLEALLAAGNVYGHFAPPGVDPDADVITDATRVLAGNPFVPGDPIIDRALKDYRDFRSAITTVPQGRVPIYWAHGLTDPLFTAFEPLTLANALHDVDPTYPIGLFLGDFGHDYTGQRVDEGQASIARMNDFVDHYLRPDRTPIPPAFDVTAAITRCLDHDAPMQLVTAPRWHDLHPEHVVFESAEGGITSTLVAGPAATATDPTTGATLPLPGAYKGCRIMRPSEDDPTAVTYLFNVGSDLVMMGGPVIDIDVSTTSPDVPLNVRMWDVAADGSEQGLITRHTYRVADAFDGRVSFQLAPQGYRFPAGHRIKIEVVANDFPYYQASNIPGVAEVTGMRLTIPVLGPDTDSASDVPGDDAVIDDAESDQDAPAPSPLPATGGGLAAIAVVALGWAAGLRRGKTGTP